MDRLAEHGMAHVPRAFAGWVDRLNEAFDDMLAAMAPARAGDYARVVLDFLG
jgi:hypothetical protein